MTRPMRTLVVSLSAAAAWLAHTGAARAETYQVGPGKEFATLDEVEDSLEPGDVVELDGGATYPEDTFFTASGAQGNPITIRGVGDARPVLTGRLQVAGDHIVLEHLEMRDGTPYCLSHGGDDLVVRDVIVHDCPNHGILGSDEGSGSLLLEYVEVYGNAQVQEGNRKHQIYIATDEVAHPGSVFRMQHSYVHSSGNDGSNIKSRAERTELYFNWIEGGGLYEAEFYGPDEGATPDGWSPDLAREDADVVGNVFLRTENQAVDWIFRIGGDGDTEGGEGGNDTGGRVRFLANTVIAPGGTGLFRTFNRLDSVEVHSNVFFGDGGGLQVLDDGAQWVSGAPVFVGDHNWVSDGSDPPGSWTDTIVGSDPGFADLAARDLRPGEGSPLVDAGLLPTTSPAGFDFPAPLAVPFYQPGDTLLSVGAAQPRPEVGALDVGAFELGSGPPRGSGAGVGSVGSVGSGPSGNGAAGPAGAGGSDAGSGDGDDDDGCGCRLAGAPGGDAGGLAAIAALGLVVCRRRRRARVRARTTAS